MDMAAYDMAAGAPTKPTSTPQLPLPPPPGGAAAAAAATSTTTAATTATTTTTAAAAAAAATPSSTTPLTSRSMYYDRPRPLEVIDFLSSRTSAALTVGVTQQIWGPVRLRGNLRWVLSDPPPSVATTTTTTTTTTTSAGFGFKTDPTEDDGSKVTS